jgi:hypothetical protein
MPKSSSDHASGRTPPERGAQHLSLLLSGEFTPVELLAESQLDAAQKREVLAVWVRDLEASSDQRAAEVLEGVRRAMTQLDEEARRGS